MVGRLDFLLQSLTPPVRLFLTQLASLCVVGDPAIAHVSHLIKRKLGAANALRLPVVCRGDMILAPMSA